MAINGFKALTKFFEISSLLKAKFYLAQNFRFFISKAFRKKSYYLKVVVPEFQKYKKK